MVTWNHRRPFNACWRLLDLPELTPRKYIQQGTQLKSVKNYELF